MTDIAQKIEDRSYQSPSRARQALARSGLSLTQKRKLAAAIQAWEDEGALEPPIVGALPAGDTVDPHFGREVHEGQLVEPPAPTNGSSSGELRLPALVNLNAFVRARLTPFGMHILYTARKDVPVPDDVLRKGGVWETTLAHFMIAFGQHLQGPDNAVPVERFEIEFLNVRP
jgi:hypothetical protein